MHENSSNFNIGWKSIQINVMNKYLQVIHSKFSVHNLIAMQTNFQNCMSNMLTSKHFKTYAIFKSLQYIKVPSGTLVVTHLFVKKILIKKT